MNKIALITGSRRGIGLAAAKALAREGYHVIVSAASSAADSIEAMKYFSESALSAEYIKCDISLAADRERIFDYIKEKYGRLDLLVNNAGVAPAERLDILETTEESFSRLMNINLKGTFFMSQAAAKLMLECKKNLAEYSPRIINISSISAYTSSVNRGEYCISKAGISMTTALFADRLAGEGIPVFEVRPGIIETDMTAAVHEKYEELIINGLTPIKRFGKPEDVADCILALSGGLLDFATGQVINADGGFHIRRL